MAYSLSISVNTLNFFLIPHPCLPLSPFSALDFGATPWVIRRDGGRVASLSLAFIVGAMMSTSALSASLPHKQNYGRRNFPWTSSGFPTALITWPEDDGKLWQWPWFPLWCAARKLWATFEAEFSCVWTMVRLYGHLNSSHPWSFILFFFPWSWVLHIYFFFFTILLYAFVKSFISSGSWSKI